MVTLYNNHLSGKRYRVRLLLWSLCRLFWVVYDDLMTGVTRTATFLML